MKSLTISNPLDLPYRLQNLAVGPKRSVSREAADPSIVRFQDRFYLFASMSGGFWHSDDLVTWSFVETPTLPNYDYAPDVREIDGSLVVCASRPKSACSFYRSADPLSGVWEEIPGTFAFWDPSLFQDDDGRVYLYWGCSAKTPIWGIELDRATFAPIGERVVLIENDVTHRGWERLGENHRLPERPTLGQRLFARFVGSTPFIEGAWMTKHDGRYYLQYSAPGTQYNTYADGYYTATSPLGPFTYSAHSPFSSKPGGFITAAGHGSTFTDRHGNWWHTSTMRISKNHMFERRLGLFPAGFDEDGVLFCNQEFADYPMTIPDGPADPWSLSARMMLLSYRRPVTSSSAAPDHPASLVVDEDIRTHWLPNDDSSGQWVTVDLGPEATVHAVQVNLAEHRLRAPKRARSQTKMTAVWRRHIDLVEHPAEFLLEGSHDGAAWTTLRDTRNANSNRTHEFIVLDEPTSYQYVRLTGFRQAYGSRIAVSGLRVFGHGNGQPPAATSASASQTGPMNALVTWTAVPGAQGYNVRYGLAANKLYASWLVYGTNELDLSSLNAGESYWVAVDSFNENGITRGEPFQITKEEGDKS